MASGKSEVMEPEGEVLTAACGKLLDEARKPLCLRALPDLHII
jgi:hypothetical protein